MMLGLSYFHPRFSSPASAPVHSVLGSPRSRPKHRAGQCLSLKEFVLGTYATQVTATVASGLQRHPEKPRNLPLPGRAQLADGRGMIQFYTAKHHAGTPLSADNPVASSMALRAVFTASSMILCGRTSSIHITSLPPS